MVHEGSTYQEPEEAETKAAELDGGVGSSLGLPPGPCFAGRVTMRFSGVLKKTRPVDRSVDDEDGLGTCNQSAGVKRLRRPEITA